jgi:hypothetical protein
MSSSLNFTLIYLGFFVSEAAVSGFIKTLASWLAKKFFRLGGELVMGMPKRYSELAYVYHQ